MARSLRAYSALLFFAPDEAFLGTQSSPFPKLTMKGPTNSFLEVGANGEDMQRRWSLSPPKTKTRRSSDDEAVARQHREARKRFAEAKARIEEARRRAEAEPAPQEKEAIEQQQVEEEIEQLVEETARQYEEEEIESPAEEAEDALEPPQPVLTENQQKARDEATRKSLQMEFDNEMRKRDDKNQRNSDPPLRRVRFAPEPNLAGGQRSPARVAPNETIRDTWRKMNSVFENVSRKDGFRTLNGQLIDGFVFMKGDSRLDMSSTDFFTFPNRTPVSLYNVDTPRAVRGIMERFGHKCLPGVFTMIRMVAEYKDGKFDFDYQSVDNAGSTLASKRFGEFMKDDRTRVLPVHLKILYQCRHGRAHCYLFDKGTKCLEVYAAANDGFAEHVDVEVPELMRLLGADPRHWGNLSIVHSADISKHEIESATGVGLQIHGMNNLPLFVLRLYNPTVSIDDLVVMFRKLNKFTKGEYMAKFQKTILLLHQ